MRMLIDAADHFDACRFDDYAALLPRLLIFAACCLRAFDDFDFTPSDFCCFVRAYALAAAAVFRYVILLPLLADAAFAIAMLSLLDFRRLMPAAISLPLLLSCCRCRHFSPPFRHADFAIIFALPPPLFHALFFAAAHAMPCCCAP